jgi:hypothetical protein
MEECIGDFIARYLGGSWRNLHGFVANEKWMKNGDAQGVSRVISSLVNLFYSRDTESTKNGGILGILLSESNL